MPRKPTARVQAERRYRERQAQRAANRSEGAKKGWETRRARAQTKNARLSTGQLAAQKAAEWERNVQEWDQRLAQAAETGMGRPIGYIGSIYTVPDGPGGAMKASAPSSQVKVETVDHPLHYGGDTTYEAIKVIEAWRLDFCLGNAVKYICRAGRKGDVLDDLQKAAWYLNREINRIEERRGA